jgi:hypothetical protein
MSQGIPTNPLATLFHGSVTIEPGCDYNTDASGGLYGFGDMFVSRQVQIGYHTSLQSSNHSTGSLVVHGGTGIYGHSNLLGILTVLTTSNLQTTYIATNSGGVYISGGSGIEASVGSAISMITSTGDITLNSVTDRVILDSGEPGNNAITITASNAAGGIDVDTGTNSGMNISTGSLGLVGTSAQGPISLTAHNGNGSFIVNAGSDFKMLTLQMAGDHDTGILIDSASNNTSYKAIQINTSDEDGNIYITNMSTGNHAGEIQILAGSSGLTANTNTGGSITLLARNAASSFIVDTIEANKNLTIAVTGATNSALILESEGTSGNAITIRNTDAAGSILVTNATAGSGGMSMYTGSGGLTAATLFGGINLTARGAASSFINQTTAETGQDLTICVKGVYSSAGVSTGATQANKLILCSESVAGDSISLRTSGGTYLSSQGQINIQSSDTTNGINIGTIGTIPVKIGTLNSTTTIQGNLDVKGTTTTYDSTIVQIKDNFIQVNNQPSSISNLDGGLAIKRYQPAGQDACGNLVGEIVKDIGEYSGTVTSVTSGNNSAVFVSIPGTDFSTSANTYAGYWLKVTYYDGSNPANNYCWVRRIKASTAESGFETSQQTFTLYNTIDQTGVLGNPVPVEGMDLPGDANLVNTPTNPATRTFSIYPCHWILSMWDESNKEYALVCANSLGEYTNVVEPHHYINLHVNNIKANVLTVNSINNLTADVQFTTQLTDNSTTPVTLNPATSIPTPIQLGYPYPNYGVFMILVRPKTNTNTSPYAIFVVGRRNDTTSCGQVARLISVKGTNGEMLDMDWPANSYPRLFYRPAPGGAGTIDYTLKFIAV